MPTVTEVNATTGVTTNREMTSEEIAAQEASDAARDVDFQQIREMRDGLLAVSDWTQLPGGPLSDTKKAEWATYRQALRDYPATASKVSELGAWPTEPS